MTTYGTYAIDTVPAPSQFELEVRVSPFPFMAHDLTTDKLVVIVDRAPCGNWVDRRGCLHQWKDITEDLGGYAAMEAADDDDEHATQADALS